MTTILITGGAGFIGSNFVRYLSEQRPDWKMIVVDKLTYAGNLQNLEGLVERKGYIFVKDDISDRAAMARVFQSQRPELVANFAAETHVDRSILDASSFIATNVAGTQVLLECSRQFPVQRFLQVSTDEVYGSAAEGTRFAEDSPLNPSSPYAASKAAADLMCLAYHHTFGLPLIITRSSNNYGPYQFPEKFIPVAILAMLRGEPIPVYGDGGNMRDWLHISDNCVALLRVMERGRLGQVYNVATGQERSNLQVVEGLCRLFAQRNSQSGSTAPSFRFVDDRPGHDRRYALATDKLRRETGWAPAVGFDDGLAQTMSWYLEHRSWTEQVTTGTYQEYYDAVYRRSWGSR